MWPSAGCAPRWPLLREGRLTPQLERSRELKAAVQIALNTELRRTEIISRRKSDFDPKARTLNVIRKGGKRQTIPLNAEAAAEFEALAASAPPDGRLFRLTRNALSSKGGVFKNALKDAGITGLTFHDLRRTFASRAVAGGIDRFILKTLMGHESLNMTDHYVSVGLEDLRDALDRHGGRNVIEVHQRFTGDGAKDAKRA